MNQPQIPAVELPFPAYLRGLPFPPLTASTCADPDNPGTQGAEGWAPASAGQTPESLARRYAHDGTYITAAATRLHPLLGKAAAAALDALLPWPASRRTYARGQRLLELGAVAATPAAGGAEVAERGLHLLLAGTAKLVAVTGKGTALEARREVTRYRSGQWIGMPLVLRAYHAARGIPAAWPEDRELTLEVVAVTGLTTQRIDLDDAVRFAEEQGDGRLFVEHHVAVRFARREEMLALLARNPITRLLNPPDREYLLQLGAVKRAPGPPETRYMKTGAPSGRVALLLRGQANAFVTDPAGARRFAATFVPGDLLGHEALVMDGEDAGAPPAVLAEAPRATDLFLEPASEVLELFWLSARWTLDESVPVWERVVRAMRGEAGWKAPGPPRVHGVHGARAGLGISALGYATTAALAERQMSRCPWLIDLQGAENFEKYWKPLGYRVEQTVETMVPLRHAGATPVRLAIFHLLPPDAPADPAAVASPPPAAFTTSGGAPAPAAAPPLVAQARSLFAVDRTSPPSISFQGGRFEVVWPEDPRDAPSIERLTDYIKHGLGVVCVVLAGRGDVAPDEAARELADRLAGRCNSVLCVADDRGARYPFAEEEPPGLTWVYRLTPDYLAREAALAGFAAPAAPEPAPAPGLPPARWEVRVPDDEAGARLIFQARFGELLAAPATYPLARAAARLERVVRRCTVGLALGGGGAWGFAHVALIEHLEQQSVPIDYIAGTSFGSVVGSLYAAGGLPALQRLVTENAARGPGLWAVAKAIALGPLNRTTFLAMISSEVIEGYINGEAQRATPGHPAPPLPCLGSTEIPFYPVATDLDSHQAMAESRSSLGYGVRLSSSLPPAYMPVYLEGATVVDGGLVANVPSRLVRTMGARFVIAANVVPPARASRASPGKQHWGPLMRQTMGRLENAVRGGYVAFWKAGEDQGELTADERLSLRPTGVEFYQTWRGPEIVAQIKRDHFSGEQATQLSLAWLAFRDRHDALGAR